MGITSSDRFGEFVQARRQVMVTQFIFCSSMVRPKVNLSTDDCEVIIWRAVMIRGNTISALLFPSHLLLDLYHHDEVSISLSLAGYPQ